MSTAREHRYALVLMVGATLCWASAGVLVRNMTLKDGWEMTFWRSFFMTIAVGAWLSFQHRGSVWQKIRAVGLPGLISAAMLTLMFISFILSLSMTTVANVLVVSSSAPFFSALLGWILLGERVPMRTWLAMAVAIAGIVVMFVQALSGEGWQGMLLSLVIPVAFGVNIAVLRKMHASVDMIPGILLAGALSALATLPVALPFEAGARDLGLLAIMGAVQLGLGCILMVIASRHLSAAEIGLTSILETVFGTLSVWLLVGEQPSPATLVGGAMVIGALAANQYVALRFRPAAATAN